MEIVGVAAFDLDGRNVALPQRSAGRNMYRPVDVRRVGIGAPFCDGRSCRINNDLQSLPNLLFEQLGTDPALLFHQAAEAAFLDLLGDGCEAEIVGGSAFD